MVDDAVGPAGISHVRLGSPDLPKSPVCRSQVEVKVSEMVDQVVQALPLGPVVGLILQVSEPGVAVLPVDVLDRLHRLNLRWRHPCDFLRRRRRKAKSIRGPSTRVVSVAKVAGESDRREGRIANPS